MHADLTSEERLRYRRHLILKEVGMSGQLKLKAAKVLLVGAGGLGSPTGLYLAASGVGTIGLVDFDKVDHTNLHRQVIHGTSDIGRSKLDSAADTMVDINPNVKIIKHETMLTRDNALEIIRDYDLVVDGTDNFQTRYLVNDACVLLGKINVYGSIFQFEGQATVFCAPGGPCYRCLYPVPPPPGTVPSCAEGGVLGVLPGAIGLIQATEAVKLILGIGDSLVGRLMLYDALGMSFSEFRIRRDPDCPICGDNPTIKELVDYDALCGIQPKTTMPNEIDPVDFAEMVRRSEPYVLIDVREPHEVALSSISGSIRIPLGQLPDHLDDFDRSAPIIVHCQSGVRSQKACTILRENGFTDVQNLTGGILQWMKSGGEIEQ